MPHDERFRNEAYKELESLTSEMNYYVKAVVVEGPHDKKTLNLLGYKNRILLCSKRSHNDLVDLVAKRYSNVVVLTDFDPEGIALNRRLSHLFEERGVKVEHFYRRRFRYLLTPMRISTIEGIYNLKPEKK